MIDTGAGGVRIGPAASGLQPDARLLNVGTTVTNSILENGGAFYQEGAGVLAQQVVAANISHNTIRNFSYTGVSIGAHSFCTGNAVCTESSCNTV